MLRREFKGRAGTLYLHETHDDDQKWDVWFEDFCIIGCGNTPAAAMDDAVRHAANISKLAKQAFNELGTTPAMRFFVADSMSEKRMLDAGHRPTPDVVPMSNEQVGTITAHGRTWPTYQRQALFVRVSGSVEVSDETTGQELVRSLVANGLQASVVPMMMEEMSPEDKAERQTLDAQAADRHQRSENLAG